MTDPTDARLAAQYEAFPYPARDPAAERRRLVVGSPSRLAEIDHWVFGAARPRSRPLRALVAGGGTGDATIMLAQQMADAGRPGSVTYLDRSAAAAAVARERARVRGLRITWREGSLLDLPGMGLEPFDYIDCCGVLHHLPDPAAGLRALLSVLAPGGGMGLMVYAPHGRTGVYMLQDAMRLLTPESEAPSARLDTARRVMRHLPQSAWLHRNGLFADHISGGEAGLYDLLLNPRDRAYTVSELHALLAGEGLRVTCWMEPLRYDPAIYLPDAKLRARAAALDPLARAVVAEALCGNMGTHIVYAGRDADVPAPPDGADPAAVPIMRDGTGAEFAGHVQPGNILAAVFDGLRVELPLPRLAVPLLRQVDGVRSVAEIIAALPDPALAAGDWPALYRTLSALDRLLIAPPP